MAAAPEDVKLAGACCEVLTDAGFDQTDQVRIGGAYLEILTEQEAVTREQRLAGVVVELATSAGTPVEGDIRLRWQSVNTAVDGVRIYRAATPFAIESLPSPLADIPRPAAGEDGAYEYLDADVGAGNQWYYRIGEYKVVESVEHERIGTLINAAAETPPA